MTLETMRLDRSPEAQARWKDRLRELGYVRVTVWVPAHARREFVRAAATSRYNPGMTIAALIDRATGELRWLRRRE
jgi:hypothetical protein